MIAAVNPETTASPNNENKAEDAEREDVNVDLYSEEAEWDRGGKSHCGYSDAVHNALMGVGESVHRLVGEPSEGMEKELKAVGNWFQEASYAARDLFHGSKEGEEDNGMTEDALDAVKTILRGGSQEMDKNPALLEAAKEADKENAKAAESDSGPTNSA